MPELPEVESTVRYLRERILGRSITEARVLWHRSAVSRIARPFDKALPGFRIDEVFRRGKFIGLRSDNRSARFLFIHLRMSGTLDVVSRSLEIAPHDRVVLSLDNGKSIRFNDTRKFGRMYLCNSTEEVVGALGIEPLSDEFQPETLREILNSKKTRIKPLLLDQTAIAGLGNIYVDECLWKARIHPQTPACRVPREKSDRLHAAIKETLTQAIELAGTDFGDGVVEGGMYTPIVYGRERERCPRCDGTIRRLVVAQRGTHICPRCQRVPARR